MQGLDQFKLENTKTFDLETPKGDRRIMLPTGEKTTNEDGEEEDQMAPVTITVRRMTSREVQIFLNRAKNKKLEDPKRIAKMSAESMEDEGVALLVFCVTGWTNLRFEADGPLLPCTPANVRSIMKDERYVWIRQQIDQAVGNDAGFLGNS